MLDELLIFNDVEECSQPSGMAVRSSGWFSENTLLGVDDNKDLMYSLNRSEQYIFTAITITGLILIGSFVTWLIG
ncbi:hypothetical protein GCM10027185_27140 [Spirosoma pulveris]